VPEGSTIADLLAELDVAGHMHISVNEDLVEDWETKLHDGDRLELFPPTAGG
jgi:sulfur carrier protein ThiS